MFTRLINFMIPKNNQKGQSLVELAITLTLLLILLAGVVDFGSAFLDYISMRDAAQEGALFGSIGYKPPDMTFDQLKAATISRVRESSSNPLDLDQTAVTVIFIKGVPPAGSVTTDPCTGDYIKVKVDYAYPLVMPFIAPIIGSNHINLSANVTNVVLKPECPQE